ncbi:hypothetical protein ACIPY3_02540 [Paenarthrobacter sp. NPDC089714]|uniref:hypothetical protein n=1 Tax=Paenarthrobacter sp. NPDC089714 TaxID=3364377 RepID=UPI0037F547DC
MKELKGKCRLCKYPVTLERSGKWTHGGGISAAIAHSVAVGLRRLADAENQANYALAGPSRGSK